MTEYLSVTRESVDQLAAIVDAMRQGVQPEEIVVTAARIPEPLPVVEPPAPQLGEDASFAFADYGAFYDFLRTNKLLGPTISADEFDGCDTIIRECAQAGWPVSWTAYALATAYHETAQTMQPIKEYGGTTYYTRMYDINGARPAKAKELGNLSPGDGAKYAGRGYPQTTGKKNYARATAKLREMGFTDLDLVADPDRMMEPAVAAATMISGMQEGWFTGRKVSDDLPARGPATVAQFTPTRDVINGHDDEALIAGYAVDFQTGLLRGGYKIAA